MENSTQENPTEENSTHCPIQKTQRMTIQHKKLTLWHFTSLNSVQKLHGKITQKASSK